MVVGRRFIEYANRYDMRIRGIQSLIGLIKRAEVILEEIRTPYSRNQVISDGFIQPKSSDEDYNSTSEEILYR
jgi:hypothetical protein